MAAGGCASRWSRRRRPAPAAAAGGRRGAADRYRAGRGASPARRRRWPPRAAEQPHDGDPPRRRRPRRARSALTYVAAAPLWKPSWRLLVPPPGAPGEARLQGWAVVENRSGADWDGVRLALVSGNPAAFRQPLYTPILRAPAGAAGARRRAGVRRAPIPAARPPPPPAPRRRRRPRRPPAAARGGARCAAPQRMPPAAPPGAVAAARQAARRSPPPGASPSPCRRRRRCARGETANLPFLDARAAGRAPVVGAGPRRAQPAAGGPAAQRVRRTCCPTASPTVYGAAGAEAGRLPRRCRDPRRGAGGEPPARLRARPRRAAVQRASRPARTAGRHRLRAAALSLIGTLRREETALAVDPRGAQAAGWCCRPAAPARLRRRASRSPRRAISACGTRRVLDGTPTTLRFAWEREGRSGDPALGCRASATRCCCAGASVDVEREPRRLPGGPGTLETLRTHAGAAAGRCAGPRRRWPAGRRRWPRRGACWTRRATAIRAYADRRRRAGPRPHRRRGPHRARAGGGAAPPERRVARPPSARAPPPMPPGRPGSAACSR